MHGRVRTFVGCTLVFLAFFLYYFQTSNLLPVGAGPDWKANNDAVEFLYVHRRLAVLPDDEALLNYTAYGSTRTLRPQLSYLTAAVMAGILPGTGENPHVAYRKGSALLGALTVALVFYALLVLFERSSIALAGSLLVGLLPQFSFLASYNNDDTGAVFAASLVFLALALIFRRGVDVGKTILFGLGCGLVIFSKPTAWLILPTVLLFLLLFVRVSRRQWLPLAGVALLACIVGGGWWIGFNVQHYGIGDPFARGIATTIGEQHRRLPEERSRSFADQGYSYSDIVLHNAQNFWGRTAMSTIGKLDWLRLDMGTFQYALYLLVFFVAMGGYLVRVGVAVIRAGPPSALNAPGRLGFDGLLFFAVSFQLAVYTWRNMATEVQLQGKYLLPTLLPLTILFFGALVAATTWLARRERTLLSTRNLGSALVGLFTLLFVLSHLDGLFNHVLPYYRPPAYELQASPLSEVEFDPRGIIAVHDAEITEVRPGMLQVQGTGPDPWLVLDPGICKLVSNNTIVRAVLETSMAGVFRIYVDPGGGFSDRFSFGAPYPAGNSEILIPVSAPDCQGLRLDPATAPGAVRIRKLSFTRLRIRPPG